MFFLCVFLFFLNKSPMNWLVFANHRGKSPKSTMVFLVQKNGRGKAQVYSAAWSPFGDVILTACGDDRIRVFRPEVRSEKFDNSGWM